MRRKATNGSHQKGGRIDYGIQGRWIGTLPFFFLFLGGVARLIRYLLCFPLWGDEACLAANFISRGYGQLLQPLDYYPVAPVLFLWAEKAVVTLFGFTEYTLRLFPLLAGIAGLIIFYRIARKILTGLPLLLAVGVFSVAYYPIRHGAEVKPYSTDLLVSLIFLWLASGWLTGIPRKSRLVVLCLFLPVGLGFSYPAVFVAGAIAILFSYRALRSRKRPEIATCFIFGFLLLAAFGAIFFFFTRIQLDFELGTLGGRHMFSIWERTFPPLEQPGRLALWLLRTHTGRMFAYPVGGTDGGSVLTFICFAVGMTALGKRKDKGPFLLFLSPFLLGLLAAAVRRYPYGYSARWMLYLAPFISIPAGKGAALLLGKINLLSWRKRITVALIAVFGMIGAGSIIRDLVRPYKEPADHQSREFARWFWREASPGIKTFCVTSDLGEDFFPGLFLTDHNSARYHCNRKIYSPRHHCGRVTFSLPNQTSGEKFNLVVYRVPGIARDDRAFGRLLRKVQQQADWTDYQRYQINRDTPLHREIYEVYRFTVK